MNIWLLHKLDQERVFIYIIQEEAWNSLYGVYKNGVHFNHYHAYTSQPSLNAVGEEIKAGHAY